MANKYDWLDDMFQSFKVPDDETDFLFGIEPKNDMKVEDKKSVDTNQKGKTVITVVDSPCGSGKTSWACQFFNDNPDGKYVFATPLLTEITRIINATTGRFVEPENYDSVTGEKLSKIEDFNNKLREGKSVAVTHKTLLNATEETIQLVRDNGYTLILDEALDVIEQYNGVNVKISGDDIQTLLDKGFIAVDTESAFNRIRWIDEKKEHSTGVFNEIYALASTNSLYMNMDGENKGNTVFIHMFSPNLFSSFQNVYVLTYLFRSTILRCYFDLWKFDYQMKNVRISEPEGEYVPMNRYELVDWTTDNDAEFKHMTKNNIEFYSSRSTDKYGEDKFEFSARWYENKVGKSIGSVGKEKEDTRKRIRKDLKYFFDNTRSKQSERMWTTYKDYEDVLTQKGYKYVVDNFIDDKSLPQRERIQNERKAKCFVSCNIVGTNDFRDRARLAYLVKLSYNPNIKKFLTSNNVQLHDKDYQLFNLLQWIYRSRIRDGKKIVLWIGSFKLKSLFEDWLDGRYVIKYD